MGQKKCWCCCGTGKEVEHKIDKDDRIQENKEKVCANCKGTGRVSSGKERIRK